MVNVEKISYFLLKKKCYDIPKEFEMGYTISVDFVSYLSEMDHKYISYFVSVSKKSHLDITSGRRQSKMPILLRNIDQKFYETRVFDLHLSPPVWRQMAIKNSVSINF